MPGEAFERAMETFAEYDDQTTPFTDHVVSAHAFDRDATVYTFDAGDFDILGNDVILRRPDTAWPARAEVDVRRDVPAIPEPR